MRIRHTQPPACEPIYSDDGQEIEFYNDCNNPKCATSVTHSAANDKPR